MSVYHKELTGEIFKETIVIESTISYFGNEYEIEHKISDKEAGLCTNVKTHGKIRNPLKWSHIQLTGDEQIDTYLKMGNGQIPTKHINGSNTVYKIAKRLLEQYDKPYLCRRFVESRTNFLKYALM